MPVDDQDNVSGDVPEPEGKDARTPPTPDSTGAAQPAVLTEAAVERDANRPEPLTPQGRERKFITRRNAAIAAFAVVAGAIALFLVAFIAYRLGFVDKFLASQIKNTFSQYGIRAEIRDVHTGFSKRTVEMLGVVLYDAKTGAEIGKIDRLNAQVRIEDLYAFNLKRNVNLESLVVDGVEVWVKFDEKGNSNFRNLHVPPKAENERILFSYSTANVQLNNAVVHYGDEEHHLNGEARNIKATVQPETPVADNQFPTNLVTFALSNSTFTYDGRPVENINVQARGRVNDSRADIDELVLQSPVMEAHLQGSMDDWSILRYHMQATATVDLTQISDVLQSGTTLRGAGNFTGNVTGEGSRYNVQGNITSDALAADGIRVKALNLTAQGSGDSKTYDLQGKVLADLLTAGNFQLNAMQLAGQVMGTGTDFRWLGELRAAAVKGPGVTIAGLILNDAIAESRSGTWNGSAKSVVLNNINSGGASVSGARVDGLKVRLENNVTTASAGSAQVGTIATSDGRVNGVTTGNIAVINKDAVTNVTVDNAKIGNAGIAGVQTGSINIAGVRLAILAGGRVEGSSSDIEVGTVTLTNAGGKDTNLNGKIESVKLAKPVFVLEPSGRYRASADLSLGGGMLGSMNLGAARAGLVASNDQYQINDFTADILNGHASGNAVISTARGGDSRLNAGFENLDIGNLVGVLTGDIVPIAGNAAGKVNLSFPGTNFAAASGTVNTDFTGEAGDDDSGKTPLTGTIALNANRGLFNIERANLKTAQSEINASGEFSFNSPSSNLQVSLNSKDTSELQRVMASSGLFAETDAELKGLGIELKGNLAFNGTVHGNLTNPTIDGRTSLDSLTMNGRNLGSFTASLNITPEEIRIPDGKLTEPDGGGVTFAFVAPRSGVDNISVDATLDHANAGVLAAAFGPILSSGAEQSTPLATLSTLQSDLSGRIQISGIPRAMNGVADLRFGKGSLEGEPFDSIVTRATFKDSVITVENVNASFAAGQFTASGTIDVSTQAFDVKASAKNIQLDHIRGFASNPAAVPELSGSADLDARASGKLLDFTSYQIDFDGKGKDVTINGNSAGELTLKGQTENKQLNVEFKTGLLGQLQVVTAHVDLSNERLPTTIETKLSGADLGPLFAAFVPQAAQVDAKGRASGTLRMVGNLTDEDGNPTLAGLRGTAEFTELTLQIEDVPLTASVPLVVKFQSNEVTFEKAQFTGQGTNVVFGGTTAIGSGGRQSFTVDGRLNLRVLNSLSPNIFLGGQADVAVRVSGTYESPRVTGTASVNGGSFATLVGDQRLNLTNIKGSLRFDANRAQIESLTGNLGGGKIVASGGASLEGFIPRSFRFTVHGDNVTVPYPEDFSSTANADLVINGNTVRGVTSTIISGTVNLKRAQYTQDIQVADFLSRRQEASLTEGSSEFSLATTTQLELRVDGRDALVIRNNLADIVGSVSLRVTGPIDDPIVSGRITASRGTLNFRNDRYELSRAYIDLPASRGADPILNIQAESEIRGYQVIVSLTGPLSQPQANIRSDPSLPQADVVSLITTGELASNDTSSSVLGQSSLGTAASLLTDTLINAPAQKATNKLFGLNRFSIDPFVEGRGGSNPTARLSVGRQVNKNLSIIYSTNVASTPNQVVALEYRLSNKMSFVARYEQGQVNDFTVRNDNFGFEIRFQRRF